MQTGKLQWVRLKISLQISNDKRQRKTKMDNPLISVIIPVYNSKKYLRQCLDSVSGQTFKNIEIICVDDGSKDDSYSVLEEYRQRDDRFVLIRQTNGGAGKARNTGLSVAKGRYLSFLDSDDIFEDNMLELAYKKMQEKNYSFVVFRSDAFDVENEYYPTTWTIHKDKIDLNEPITFRSARCNIFLALMGWAWDKLYDAEFIRDNGLRFQEIRTSNDMSFVFSALLLADSYGIIDKTLAHHRRNDKASLSHTREKSWHCFHDALIDLRKNAISYGLFPEVEHDYINYCVHSSLWNLRTINGPSRKKLYNALKNEWFHEFGISGKPDAYFTDANDLRIVRKIECCSVRYYYMEKKKEQLLTKIRNKVHSLRNQ